MTIAQAETDVVHEQAVVAEEGFLAGPDASADVVLEDAGLHSGLRSACFGVPNLNGSSCDISSPFAFGDDAVLDEEP